MTIRTALTVALLTLPLALAGCSEKKAPKAAEIRPVRTAVVEPRMIEDDRQAVGEIRPRYETDMSFRVSGKMRERLVDVGATVKKGDVLARLDEQDYENRLRSAEADVASAEASLVESQGAEARQGKLLKDGYTPRSTYDTTLRNLRAAEAKLTSSRANLDLTKDQLKYTELKADFDGIVTAVAAEAGQNVSSGQMVVKVAQPGDKDAVFTIAESAFRDHKPEDKPGIIVAPLSNPDLVIDGVVREVAPVADPTTRTYLVKVTLKDPPPQIRFGMSVSGRLKANTAPVVVLPLAALFDKNKTPAVWVFTPSAAPPAATTPTATTPATPAASGSTFGTVLRKPVTISRYEADKVVIAGGLTRGEIVVTAGVNMLRDGQRVRLNDNGTGNGGAK